MDLFLSYASPDLAQAAAIHACLTAEGFSVWFDKRELNWGDQWHQEIEQACEAARIVLPVLTPNWRKSEWTRYETYGAETILPLLVVGRWQDVSTPPLIRVQKALFPLDEKGNEAAWQRLFAAIRAKLAQPAATRQDRIIDISHNPTPHFVGREAKLTELHEKLFTCPTTALTQQGHIQAVTALGGVGKTTLARHYAEKFWRAYREIFWIDCVAGIETGFARIHNRLRPNPAFAALPEPDKARWALTELSRPGHPDTLLILDNAVDQNSILRWIPASGACHTLITSRSTAWTGGIGVCEVWVLEPGPARELLLKRSERAHVPGESEPADALAQKLEYLPLALEQGAAYVAAQPQGFGFAKYLELYRTNEQELLDNHTPGATDYPASVYLTWRTTINKLPQGARAILRLHAFAASSPFPVEMYIKAVAEVAAEARQLAAEEGQDPEADLIDAGKFAVRAWIAALLRYSMAVPQPGDAFSVHALVQAVERHALGERAGEVLSRTTGLMVGHSVQPSWEPENRAAWDILLPHAEKVAEGARGLHAPDDALLLDRVAMTYHHRGNYGQAIAPQRASLVAFERVLGKEHRSTLTSANNLAGLLESQGEYAEAETLYRRTLEACERLLGKEDPDTLRSMNNLAALLYSQGEYAQAEPLYRRALQAQERVLGKEDPDTLSSLNNLALLLHTRGEYAQADPLFRRALEARERVLGKEHPDTLTSVNNLAALLNSQGEYAQAEPLCRRALEASELVLGKEHPNTLTSLNNLAVLLHSQGEYAQAEPLFWRALEAQERVLGEEHPSTKFTRNNLETLLEIRRATVEREVPAQSPLRIGRATMAEVPRVAEIIELCKQQMNASGSDQWDEIYPTEAVVAADARADSLFTGWLDGLCAAAVCLNEQQAPEYAGLNWRDSGGHPLVIHRLCVDPALQNRGIAAKLMDFAEDFARQNSYTSIRLDTYTGNPRALALYERRGYTRTGQIRFPRRRMMFDCFEKMQSV